MKYHTNHNFLSFIANGDSPQAINLRIVFLDRIYKIYKIKTYILSQ